MNKHFQSNKMYSPFNGATKNMETETMQKNEASPKSQTSRRNLSTTGKILFAVTFLVSCGTLSAQEKKETRTSYQETRVVNVPQYFHGTLITPQLCDYKILTPTSVTDSIVTSILFASIPYEAIHTWMAEFTLQAQMQLAKKYNADAVVGLSRYITTTADGRVKVIVSGFPVQYVNFRNATEDDLWMLKFYTYLERELKQINLNTKSIEKVEEVKR